jgi:hypothetical protein
VRQRTNDGCRRAGVEVGYGGIVWREGVRGVIGRCSCMEELSGLQLVGYRFERCCDILKATRRYNSNHLRVRVHELESVVCVWRNSTEITSCENTSLLIAILLCPYLEAALVIEEALVMDLVEVRKNSKVSRSGSIGLDESKGIARGGTDHWESEDLLSYNVAIGNVMSNSVRTDGRGD